jgi:hypothetical protein
MKTSLGIYLQYLTKNDYNLRYLYVKILEEYID